MTLKELKENYRVESHNGKYLIYDAKEGSDSRSVFKYLCQAFKRGGCYGVEGFKATTKLDVFKTQVEEYIANLKYDSNYFNPRWREGLKEKLMVHDYMGSLEFENVRSSIGFYKLKRKSIYGYQTTNITLGFHGLEEIEEEVRISLSTGDYSGVTLIVKRDFESIKEGIDTLLKPLLMTEGIQNLQTSDKLEVGDLDIIQTKLVGTSVYSADMKKELKEKLLALAEQL